METSCQTIGVHVGDPALIQGLPEWFPAGNSIGTLLLHRMLEAALLREGLIRGNCSELNGAELNDCVFIALVTDAERAAQIVKRELAASFIIRLCQIGIRGDDGWRCIYPSPELRVNWLMEGEQSQAAAAKFQQACSTRLGALRNILKGLGHGKDQPGDKP